jgi:hypothetical protein
MRRRRTTILIGLAAVLVIGITSAGATWSAWNAQTGNSGNSFTAGTAVIRTDSPATAVFEVPAMRPSIALDRCLTVTYRGTLPAAVRLYGEATAGTGLGSYLRLTIVRGTAASSRDGDCGRFVPDGDGGLRYQGLLADLPADYADGVADEAPPWTGGESHTYRFRVELIADNAAQGRSVTESFTWEGR